MLTRFSIFSWVHGAQRPSCTQEPHAKETLLPLFNGQAPKGRTLTWDAQLEGYVNLLTEQGPLTI